MTAHARTTDPATSKAAAEGHSESQLTATQQRVLNCFRLYGDMTDVALVKNLNAMERDAGLTRFTSASGARSRRKDLSRANEARLAELRAQWQAETPWAHTDSAAAFDAAADEWARRTLRLEGFRAPLWPTGKTERLQTGYQAIVWGLAR